MGSGSKELGSLFLGLGWSFTTCGTLDKSLNLSGLLLSHLPLEMVALDWRQKID